MILLREQIGAALRQRRLDLGRTLRQVSQDARVSLGYLSEVERGRKEASSELLASICAALEVRVSDLLMHVASRISSDEQRERVATLAAVTGSAGPAGTVRASAAVDVAA